MGIGGAIGWSISSYPLAIVLTWLVNNNAEKAVLLLLSSFTAR
jgi:hypothetical protein